MKLTTVFFDWGGVIADDPGDEFLAQLLRDIGATGEQIDQIFKSYMRAFMRGEISEAAYWQSLRDEFGLVIDDTISHKFTEWSGLKANKDILDLAAQLKEDGYKIAILSNVIEPTYNVIKTAGYYDIFDEVIASFQVGYAKPDPEIYRIAVDRLGVNPRECIFIDDKELCLAPARELGIKTILATSAVQIVKDVKAALN